MIPDKYRAAMEAVKYVIAFAVCVALATTGTLGIGLVLLVLSSYGVHRYTLPHLREHQAAVRERQANCPHEWREFDAMNDTSFPMRSCHLCGKHEQMDRCRRCGRTFER